MNHTIHVLLSVLLLAALSTVNVEALKADGDCKATDPNCKECDTADTTKCKTCNDKYGFDKNKKCAKCDEHCKVCTSRGAGKCDDGQCDSGYTLDTDNTCKQSGGDDCKQQDPNCKECDPADTTKCKTCIDKYGFDKNKKCAKCDEHCKLCTSRGAGKCDDGQCDDGFTLDTDNTCKQSGGDDCKQQDPNCQICVFGGVKACFKCVDGFHVSQGKCVKNDKCNIDNCAKCDDTNACTQCEDKFEKEKGECVVKCGVEFCSECQPGSSNTCKVCQSTYTLKDGKCTGKDGVSYMHVTPAAFAALLASAVALHAL